MPRIKKVTYSKPVTLIRWDDDTITKAFCDEVDNYDELTGFLMCIIKKMVPAKEMRKLFSKYVYGDDPKYIKRIVPKKERKKVEASPWCCINCNTLELDRDTAWVAEFIEEVDMKLRPAVFYNQKGNINNAF